MSDKIEISGFSPEKLADILVAQFFADWDFKERVSGQITRIIRERLETVVDSVIEEEARRAVAEKLEVGWVLLDRFGGRGQAVTLTQRIEETISAKSKRGGWSSKEPDRTFLENTVIDEVESYVKNTLRGDLNEARELFKKQVNKVLQSKLAETLADHLGIGGAR